MKGKTSSHFEYLVSGGQPSKGVGRPNGTTLIRVVFVLCGRAGLCGHGNGRKDVLVKPVVYLLETGCYEDRYVSGVYATPEAAMKAWSPTRPDGSRGVYGREYGKRAGDPWPYEWSGPDEDGHYTFGADWEDAATIMPYEVES